MAIITTRINGYASQAGYEYYLNVKVNDTVNDDNTFSVTIDAWIVNHGFRTNTNGWDKATTIYGIGSKTDTNQNLNTTNVSVNGGETLAIRHENYYKVPITTSSIHVGSAMAKSSYASYDPGYCEADGWVSMPRVQSTWNTSGETLRDITQPFSLPINKYVNDYYNVVEVRDEGQSIPVIKTINDAVNGTEVTFTNEELSTIYIMDGNANRYPIAFYMDLKTYTDSSKTTQIGTTQRVKYYSYLVNSSPTSTITLVEQDENVISLLGSSTSSKIIKNASDLLFTITATAYNGATITRVQINNDYATYDSESGNYLLNLTNITTGVFFAIIGDSRGLSQLVTINRTVIDYIAVNINSNWTIPRASQTSSDLVLSAVIDCYSSTIDGNTNIPTVQYSVDNENWTTIPSSSYTFSDNKITISNLTLQDLINYQTSGRFYLKATDLLTSSQDNKDVTVGVYTFAKSDRKVRINGTLELGDNTGNNRIEARSTLLNINSNLTTTPINSISDIESTSEFTLYTTTLNKGIYLIVGTININHYGGSGRDLYLMLYLDSTLQYLSDVVVNTNAYTISRPVTYILNVTSDNTSLSIKSQSTSTARYDIGNSFVQIMRLK